jgi:hypothetical protein
MHTQNETFLSSISTAAAMNYASLTGNKDYSLGISLYNAHLTEMCNQDHFQKIKNLVMGTTTTSDQSYADYLNELKTNNQSFAVRMRS